MELIRDSGWSKQYAFLDHVCFCKWFRVLLVQLCGRIIENYNTIFNVLPGINTCGWFVLFLTMDLISEILTLYLYLSSVLYVMGHIWSSSADQFFSGLLLYFVGTWVLSYGVRTISCWNSMAWWRVWGVRFKCYSDSNSESVSALRTGQTVLILIMNW